MSDPTGACLKIRLEIGNGESKVTFIPGGSPERDPKDDSKDPNERTFHTNFARHQLPELIRDVRSDLVRVREGLDAVGAVKQTEASAGLALKRLSYRGWRVLMALLGNDAGNIAEATAICRAACPGWQKPAWDKEAILPPLVTVVSRGEDGIPVEFLPLFDPAPVTDPPVNFYDMGQVACRFLGFSAVVQRLQPGQTSQPGSGRRLENQPVLPLGTFFYRGLPTLSRHQEFFRENAGRIELRPAWPAADCPIDRERVARELATRIWNPTQDPPPQINYFFCHCDTDPSSTERHALRFNTGGNIVGLGGERRAELGLLQSAIVALQLKATDDKKERPLVFLNACASGAIDPSGVGSFPQVFSDKRFLGFIGTESAVPDAFASAFAQDFFARILDGIPLGHALHRARWAMLAKPYFNPLGLLYTAYADPDLQVRHVASGETFRSATTDGSEPERSRLVPV